MLARTHRPTLFPYTTLFRSKAEKRGKIHDVFQGELKKEKVKDAFQGKLEGDESLQVSLFQYKPKPNSEHPHDHALIVEHRSEEHTSELQSRFDLVCRLLLEK